MTIQFHHLSPLKLSIFCGILSSILNFSSALYFQGTILFFFLFILNFFSLTPLIFVSLFHGKEYGLIAAGIVACFSLLVLGLQGAFANFLLNSLPAIYLADLIKKPDLQYKKNFTALGKGFSLICLFYLVVLVISLLFIFDQNHIQETFQRLLSGLDKGITSHLSDNIILIFPALMCWSMAVIILLNLMVTLNFTNYMVPQLRPYPLEYDKIIPSYWDIIFIAGLLLILTRHEMSAFIGKNVLLLSCLPLYLYGLSIVGGWLKQWENRNLWVGFITITSIFLVWPAIIVIVLGLLGPILKIKQDSNISS